MRDGRDVTITINLGRVTSLDPVTIAGTAKGHLAAFEKRRATGKGTFFSRGDIEKSRRHQVSEVLRTVRGLRVDCNGGSCRVLMVRSTSCEPRYFMNGFPTNAEALLTPVLDVAGIEIYRGPSETPPEFLGANSMCGAIGIWTK
jgi:outer membrane cobalamin receptor